MCRDVLLRLRQVDRRAVVDERRSVSAPSTARTCVSSSSTPASPLPDTAWYVLTTSRRRPASACSGREHRHRGHRRAVRVGDDALGPRPRASCGLTSQTTSGTSGSIRQALELSTTTAPAAANRSASARDDVAPAENSAMSMPGQVGDRGVLDDDLLAAPRQRRPAERAEARKRIARPGSPARRAVGASRRRPARWRRRRRRACDLRSSAGPSVDDGLVCSLSSPKAVCTARTAASTASARHHHRDPDLGGARSCSMLTPASASASKNVAETPGCERIAGADQRDLADLVVVEQRLEADLLAHLVSSAAIAVGPSVFGSVKEMSVRPVAAADTFCTIMSMLISASATARKIAAASPGLSGTPTTVILASLRSCATPEMIALLHRRPLRRRVARDPGALALAERRPHVDGQAEAPGVLDAAQVQHLGARRGHLEHLLVGDRRRAAARTARSAGRR